MYPAFMLARKPNKAEAVREQRELDLKDHVFTLEGGMVIQDGKSYHPDLVRLRIPKKLGLEIALQILQALQHTRATTDDEFLIELPLFGKLEDLVEES
jgi:hypothetical protein